MNPTPRLLGNYGPPPVAIGEVVHGGDAEAEERGGEGARRAAISQAQRGRTRPPEVGQSGPHSPPKRGRDSTESFTGTKWSSFVIRSGSFTAQCQRHPLTLLGVSDRSGLGRA
jgi:hypothetical protein